MIVKEVVYEMIFGIYNPTKYNILVVGAFVDASLNWSTQSFEKVEAHA